MRAWIRSPLSCVIFGALCVAGACGVDELLIGSPCADNADCPNLTCVRTLAQENSNAPGVCSEDGACVPGQQEGCAAASDGSCEAGLSVTASADGGAYCCKSGPNPTVTQVSEADGTADCFDCPSCEFMSGMEPCAADEARCEVENDAPCGCRTTDEAIIDTPCDGDEDCGTAQCVRTLEQAAEPQEPLPVEQGVEPGLCRSDETCAGGLQSGCRMPPGAGCTGGNTVQVDVGSLTYCCPEPANNTDFFPQVYVISDDQQQVACTACARRACTDEAGNLVSECTTLSDPSCNVEPGQLCGCPA